MLITAEYPWGCGLARRLGLLAGVPDACSFFSEEVRRFRGIFTGVRILACICLARANNKVRTKSFAPR